MARTVQTADTEDTIERVEEVLNSHRLSAVPVVDSKGNVFGIISSPDLLHFHAMKQNPKAVRAWELCTYRPIAVAPGTAAREVAKLMVEKKLHHILVTNEGGLQGIVSTFDFVEQYVLKGGHF